MPRINISDFRGGKDTFNDQLLAKENNCVSTSLNVWAPRGALTKMGGTTVFASFTATSTAANLYWLAFEPNLTTAYNLYAEVGVSGGGSTSYLFAGAGQTDAFDPLGYVTGTISVSGASLVSCTGSGTSWTSHVSAGDRFRVNASASTWYNVSSVEDNTHLTISPALPVSAGVGTAYLIQPGLDRVEIAHGLLNGNFVIGTLFNVMQRYDTTGMTRITAAPMAAFYAVHKNYLFCSRTNTAESRLYWSAVGDPTSWPANSSADVDRDRGKITGLFSYGNELIVFKQRSMFKVVGSVFDASNPTYAIYPIAVPNYFLFNSNYSAAIIKDTLIFGSRGTIYSYHQGSPWIQRISQLYQDDVTDTRGNINAVTGVDQRVYGISFNDYYIIKGLYGLLGSLNDAGIVDENGAWWLIRDTNAGSSNTPFSGTKMAVYASTSTSRPQLLTCVQSLPNIINWDLFGPTYQSQYVDSAATPPVNKAIQGVWISKEFSIEYGAFKQLVLYYAKQTAGNLTVEWSIDQAAFVSNTADMTTGRGNMIRKTYEINQNGSSIQLRLSNNTVGQTFKIYMLSIVYEPHPEARLT